MNKRPYDATTIAAPIVDLPPRDATEARERATREANAEAFFADFSLPPGTDSAAVHRLIERHNELVLAGDQFMIDMARTGVLDRPRFRELLVDTRQARRDLLIALGADPDSDDLLAFTAELNNS